jgi:hypothetical protein
MINAMSSKKELVYISSSKWCDFLEAFIFPTNCISEGVEERICLSKALTFLIQERKELIKGSYRDRHFNAGSILLGFGVFEAIGGGVNTWFRTGKLFPGPHLFAGAGIAPVFMFIKIQNYNPKGETRDLVG